MATTRLIPLHHNKGKTIAKCLKERTDYAENGEKTNGGELVSSYECDPKTCDREFLLAKREYLHRHGFEHRKNVLAYQIRQAFKPGEVTPEEANRIGYETAMRWTKGKHAFIVATHVDRAHVHNHIIYNSTTLDGERKWMNFLRSGKALRKVSDLVCLEHGLSIVESSQKTENTKYNKMLYFPSARTELKADIDAVLGTSPHNFDELLSGLKKRDYEIRKGKCLSFRKKGRERFLRIDTLGREYSEANLKRRILGEKVSLADEAEGRDFDLILNISEIIQKNKGAGYERWAKRYNLKQTAKALCFIKERGINTLSELIDQTDNITKCYNLLSDSLHKKQERLNEIDELKKHITNFARTKETADAYKRSGYSKKFFENHREELLLHKAAKDFFSDHHYSKLPKMKDLREEFGQILAEKKKEYAEYKSMKSEMQDLLIARQNLEALLGSEGKTAKEERTEEHQAR